MGSLHEGKHRHHGASQPATRADGRRQFLAYLEPELIKDLKGQHWIAMCRLFQ
jgi:hypothetical protein